MVSQDNIIDFVGREHEISLYEHWLSRSEGPWILSVYDKFSEEDKKGGIGKTSLLRKYIALTKEHHPDIATVMVDFFNVTDRDGIAIVARIVEALKAIHSTWFPTEYDVALQEYEAAKREGAESTSFRNMLVDALANDLARLKLLLQEAKRYLILFFDTFDLIKDNPVIALLNPTQKFPHNYQFAPIGAVIAGRYEINWDHDPNWQGRQEEVIEVPLGAFTIQEMVAYNNKRCIVQLESDSDKAAALHRCTQGRPILVGLVTDIVHHGILTLENLLKKETSPDTFAAYLVSQINRLENINWVILFMAHAHYRFNESILLWMLQKFTLYGKISDSEYPTMLEKLAALSFVRRSSTGEDFVLHDEMRHLVIRYCWEQQDPGEENRKEISRCIIEYYERELAAVEKESIIGQGYAVEMLYHKFYLDLKSGFAYFEQRFEEALKLWEHSYARSLLQEAQKFNAHLSQEHTYTLVMLEASLLIREEKYDRALQSYQYLRDEAEDDWLIKHSSKVHYGLAECYQYLGEIFKALENLAISRRLAESSHDQRLYADTMDLLGHIHQHHGSLDDAVDCYIESMNIYKELGDMREYSDKINILGYIYSSRGKTKEALHHCKIALKLRENLFAQGKVGEVPVGMSLNMLAVVYLDAHDPIYAKQYLDRAFTIFKRLGYRRGLARVYNRQGQMLMNDKPEDAMQLFQLAYEVAISIGAKEEQINSLNKQGRVLLKQGQLEKARERFEEAVRLSGSVRGYYLQAESLLDLAEVLERLGVSDDAQEALKQGESIALEYHYYSLSSRAENFQGEMSYQRQDYIKAFEHFTQSCHNMALFNPLRYSETVELLFDRLLAIPTPEQIPAIIAVIRDYWSDQALTVEYPELMHACDEVEILPL